MEINLQEREFKPEELQKITGNSILDMVKTPMELKPKKVEIKKGDVEVFSNSVAETVLSLKEIVDSLIDSQKL